MNFVGTLREAGFSDTEIRDFVSSKAAEAGFTQEEVDSYFSPPPSGIEGIVSSLRTPGEGGLAALHKPIFPQGESQEAPEPFGDTPVAPFSVSPELSPPLPESDTSKKLAASEGLAFLHRPALSPGAAGPQPPPYSSKDVLAGKHEPFTHLPPGQTTDPGKQGSIEPGIWQGSSKDFTSVSGTVNQFVENLTNEAAFGMVDYIGRQTGYEREAAKGTAEEIAAGAGKLAGFVVGGPGKVTKIFFSQIEQRMQKLALTGAESAVGRAAKLAAKEAPALGLGMMSASFGEAMKQDNLEDALKVLASGFGSGVQMGATFGATRGLFPTQRIMRIATGIALLDAQRGGHPLDERAVAQKVFDYGVDTYFLWKGMPEAKFTELEREILQRLERLNRTDAADIGDIGIDIGDVETSPTDAQKEAGNYKKGHVSIQGLPVTIENPAGSVRSGVDERGKPWETKLAHHYGYFKRTEGKDGDQVDVFVGPDAESDKAYVVDQVDPRTGEFDEHKVLIGFNGEAEAKEGYLDNYDETGKGRIGKITETTVESLKKWLREGDTKKPYLEGDGNAALPKKESITGYRSEEVYGEGHRNISEVVKHETEELGNEDIIDTLIARGIIKDKTELTPFIERLKSEGYDEVVWLSDTPGDVIDVYSTEESPISRDSVKRYDIEDGIVISDLGREGKLIAYKSGGSKKGEFDPTSTLNQGEKVDSGASSKVALETPFNKNINEIQETRVEVGRERMMAARREAAEAEERRASNIQGRSVVGNKGKAKTERHTEIGFEYVVSEAEDLLASHDEGLKQNPAYPEDRQPRDRSKLASELQVSGIENKLEPSWLGESPKVAEGAPVVDKAGIVESGNGRIVALKRLYGRGHENGQKYKQWLIDNAEKFGLKPEDIGKMKAPVLTRRRLTDVDVRRFVEEANESATASMSATEQAMADAGKLTESILEHFVPNEYGEILTASNRGFVRLFFEKVVGKTDLGRYIQKDGTVSQDGLSKIKNALFAKAYGDPDIVATLSESTDSNIKNITNAMLTVAPRIATLKENVASGTRHDLDISDAMGKAARKLSSLRQEGRSIESFFQQTDLFGEQLDPLAKDVLSVFDKYKRSTRKLIEVFNSYINAVDKLGDPKQKGLFEDLKLPTKVEILEAATNRMEMDDDVQSTLFGDEKAGGRKAEEADEGVEQGKARSGSGSADADTGGYADREKGGPEPTDEEVEGRIKEYVSRSRNAVEMPELVELAKQLLEGKYPKIAKRLRVAMGQALGAFVRRGKEGSISLRASIFQNPELAAKVLAHEIGHLIDWLPDKTMGRGNILGRIANLHKYFKSCLEEYPDSPNKVLTDEDLTRLQKEAMEQIKEEAARGEEEVIEEIVREVPIYREIGITPGMIKEVMTGIEGREKYKDLYEFMARLDAAEKKAAVKKALKGVVHEMFEGIDSKEQIGTKTIREIRKTIKKTKLSKRAIKERFDELFREEILKRKLYEKQVITDELKALTQEWKPFDVNANKKYTSFRHSGKELYADAFSVLLNEPKLMEDVAPTFRKALFSYLKRKPEVKAIYDEIQARDREDLLLRRHKNIREMFARGDKKQRDVEAQIKKKYNILREIKQILVDENEEALAAVKKAAKRGMGVAPEDNPKYWVEELAYISGEIYSHVKGVEEGVLTPGKEAGLSIDDIGEYMMLTRISTERAEMPYGVDGRTGEMITGEIASPLGHTKESALELLDSLKKRLGKDKYAALEEAVSVFWELRQKNVIPLLEKAEMYSERLMSKIRDNSNYATFDIVKAIEKRFGRNVTGKIYKQMGTLEEIKNPFVATVMKDAALIRAAEITLSKKAMVTLLREGLPGDIKPADKKWNGKYQEPIESKDPDEGMIIFADKGKIKAYYVAKGIAKTFDKDPYEAEGIVRLWQLINVPLRNVLVSRNPLWMVYNTIRDFIGSVKHIHGLTAPKLLLYYKRAFREAFSNAYKGQNTETISKMLKDKMLVLDRQFASLDTEGETELDRYLQSFGESRVRHRNMVIKPFMALWDVLGKTGKFTERWAKLAGYKYLKAESGKSDKEIAHMVRSRVGTPDVYRRGKWNILTNNLFLFSNVAKEGWRASWEAARENPSEYIWKTFKFNIVPKLLFATAIAGYMGQDLKEVCEKVSPYHAENYTVVPLGLSRMGKAVYFTIPQDYTGQVISGLFWNLINGKLFGEGSVLDYGAAQHPYNLNPYITVGSHLAQYYIRGKLPYDDYTGQPVMPERVYRAGGARANETMAKHTWNELGGGAIYKFKGEDVEKIQSEMEGLMKYPPGNILGRFLKVSNQGEREDLREITKDVRKKEAGRQLDVRDRIIESIDDAQGKPSPGDMVRLYRKLLKEKLIPYDRTISQFRAMYNRYASRTEDSPKIDAVINAYSNKEKAALVKHYRETMSKKDFNRIKRQLVAEGYLSIKAIIEAYE